jgi:hypothetical protein
VPALFFGTALLAIGLGHGVMRKHYVVIAVLWFAMASLAWFDVAASTRDAALDVTVGVALIIAGIGDHRLLRETLQPASV